MNYKILGLITLSALFLVLSLVLTSATFTVSSSTLTFTPSTSSNTFTITNEDNSSLTINFSTLTIGGQIFTITGNTTLNPLSPITYTLSSNSLDFSLVDFGDKNSLGSLTITDSSNSSETETITIYLENTDACEYANEGDLQIKIDEINVLEGFGDDEEYWYLLDEIEIEIKVENDGDEDIDNIEVRWGLYDKSSKKFIIDDKESDFDLKDGDDETIIINFALDDVDDFKDNGDYVFYVWATGEIDGGDFDGDKTCASDSEESIEIINDDNFVLLYNIEYPETASCGEKISITAEIWNIGDREEDDIFIRIYNKELGINEKIDIGNIEEYESESFVFDLTIPQNAEAKTYGIELEVYDDNSNIYETKEDDKSSSYLAIVKVEGSCTSSYSDVTISAVLESGENAGEEMIVKATVTNTGSDSKVFDLNIEGYNDWAELVGISPSTALLNSGASEEFLITLKVNKDVSGDKSFSIILKSNEEEVATQPVQVTIKGKTGINIFSSFGDNWYLWLIGILNVILVIIIIIVAIKVSRR